MAYVAGILFFLVIYQLNLRCQSTGGAYNSGASCYDCHYKHHGGTENGYSVNSGFHSCALLTEEDAYHVSRWTCESQRCFIRKDPNGEIFRGCADNWNLPLGIDTNLNCSRQGQTDAIWWFCDGNLCNDGYFHDDTRCGEIGAEQPKHGIKGNYFSYSYHQALEAEPAAPPESNYHERSEAKDIVISTIPPRTTTEEEVVTGPTVIEDNSPHHAEDNQAPEYMIEEETVHGIGFYDNFKDIEETRPLPPMPLQQNDLKHVHELHAVNSKLPGVQYGLQDPAESVAHLNMAESSLYDAGAAHPTVHVHSGHPKHQEMPHQPPPGPLVIHQENPQPPSHGYKSIHSSQKHQLQIVDHGGIAPKSHPALPYPLPPITPTEEMYHPKKIQPSNDYASIPMPEPQQPTYGHVHIVPPQAQKPIEVPKPLPPVEHEEPSFDVYTDQEQTPVKSVYDHGKFHPKITHYNEHIDDTAEPKKSIHKNNGIHSLNHQTKHDYHTHLTRNYPRKHEQISPALPNKRKSRIYGSRRYGNHINHSKEPFWMWWWHSGAFRYMKPQEAFWYYFRKGAKVNQSKELVKTQDDESKIKKSDSSYKDYQQSLYRPSYGHYRWKDYAPIRSNIYYSRISRNRKRPYVNQKSGYQSGRRVLRPYVKGMKLHDFPSPSYDDSSLQVAKTVNPLDYKSYRPPHTHAIPEPLGPVPDDPSDETSAEDMSQSSEEMVISENQQNKHVKSIHRESSDHYHDSLEMPDYPARGHATSKDDYNPCKLHCIDKPGTYYGDPNRSDRFIQCGPGTYYGEPCSCCQPYYQVCPEGTSFDEMHKVCSQTAGSALEDKEYTLLDLYADYK